MGALDILKEITGYNRGKYIIESLEEAIAKYDEAIKGYEEAIENKKKAERIRNAAEGMLGYFDDRSKMSAAMISVNDAIHMIDRGDIWSGDAANRYRDSLKDIYNKLDKISQRYSDSLESVVKKYESIADDYSREASEYHNEMNDLERLIAYFRQKKK